ncbi:MULTISPECIES: hypothetical protein [Elizabethkingia]|nr:hypothetical protein [Elizabethkingia sp. HX CGY]MCT3669819.1 hypothetical protein [Elizabethkingia anophelis]MCT3689287.1 hypothetical protein [Elizabethkingia anophelis]MCT3706133.1 hypothetical protein [Elizabethkingia anophelis]MCT3713151.1 hypothetical protein [Elizabethkingia anophelis]MCT3716569.1 hypothetical protein [Elizabethkingia anophelis]
MGQFNESYLEVPVVNQEKVVQILRVIRKGSQVYFGSNSEEKASLDFFQQLIFGKYTKIKAEEERKGKVNSGGGATAYGEVVCTTRKISMWYPDNNNNPDGSGHWESKYETKCEWVEKEKVDTIDPCVGPECIGGGGLPEGGNPGFPYPDEADKIDIEQLKDYPCAYEVAQLLPNLENNISTLLKDTFGNNNKTNITFKVDAIESEDPNYIINAATNYPPIEDGKFNATVTLNKEMVQLATQEYITSVMYHEIVHAYLGYEYNILGPSAFEQKYPAMETYVVSSTRKFRFKDDYQHTRYAPFIDRMADSIMDFSVKNNPNSTFTKESAKAIAMGGLFKDLSIAIKQIINDESTSNSHSQGTKCQNN